MVTLAQKYYFFYQKLDKILVEGLTSPISGIYRIQQGVAESKIFVCTYSTSCILNKK